MVKTKFRKIYIALAVMIAAIVALVATCVGLNAKYVKDDTVTETLEVNVASGSKKYVLLPGREFSNALNGISGVNAKSISFCRSTDLLPDGATDTNIVLSIPASSRVKLYIANRDESAETADFYVTATEGAGILYANENAGYMFAELTKLKSVNFTGCNFTLSTKMNHMFLADSALTAVDFKFLKAPLLTDAGYMFRDCSALGKVNTGNIDFSKATTMSHMFAGCSSLFDLNFRKLNSAAATTLSSMFEGCSSLTTLDLSGLSTENVTERTNMFKGCDSLTRVTLGEKFSCPDTGIAGGRLPGEWHDSYGNIYNTTDSSFPAVQRSDTYYTTSAPVLNVDVFKNCLTSAVNVVFGNYDDCAKYLNSDNKKWSQGTECGATDIANGNDPATGQIRIFSGKKYIDGNYSNVTFVLAEGNRKIVFPEECASLFKSATKLQKLILDNVDLGSVTTMAYMFDGCSALISVKFPDADMPELTTTEYMFKDCKALKRVKFGTINAPKLATTNGMFFSLTQLEDADVGGLTTTSALTNMQEMFYKCTNLKTVDLSNFNNTGATGFVGNATSNVNPFNSCNKVERLTVGENFVFKKSARTVALLPTPTASYITGADGSWHSLSTGSSYSSSSLPGSTADTYYAYPVGVPMLQLHTTPMRQRTHIIIDSYSNQSSKFNWEDGYDIGVANVTSTTRTDDRVKYFLDSDGTTAYILAPAGGRLVLPENSYQLFSQLNSVTTLTFNIVPDTHFVKSMEEMFYYCNNLTSLDLRGFDTSNVTNMHGMFQDTPALETITFRDSASDINYFDTSNVTNMYAMFWRTAVTSLDLGFFDTSNVTSMEQMFSEATSLTSLNVASFDTSKVTKMNSMFSNNAVTRLDVSSFDTSNVTTMAAMFNGCYSLSTLIGVENFDTSNATATGGMFSQCQSLTSLDVSGFDTSNVSYMPRMFCGLNNISTLDVSNFDTSNVTNMSYLFSTEIHQSGKYTYPEGKMTSLDLTGFDTSNVKDMSYMFAGNAFTSFDLSGFETAQVTDFTGMFMNLSALTELDLRYFNTRNAYSPKMDNMFAGCTALSKITLGEKFRFSGTNSYLPANGTDGLWYLGEVGYAPADISPADHPGTYVIKAA